MSSPPSSISGNLDFHADVEEYRIRAPPTTVETTQRTSNSGYSAYTYPQTPQFAFSQAPLTSSTALSSSIATPTSALISQPVNFTQPPNHASPPRTSQSAVLSTASSTSNFAFRPPSEPNSEPLPSSRGRPPTTVLSTGSAPPNTNLQTHWEQASPSLTGTSNHQSHVEDEKNSEDHFPPPNSSLSSFQQPEAVTQPLAGLGSSGSPHFSSLGGGLKYLQGPAHLGATVPQEENSLYLGDIEEDSPYPEVRASVSNTDDPDMPCVTFRVVLIGLTLGFGATAANMYLYLRYPAPSLSGPFPIVSSYVAGKLLAAILPIRSWNIAGYEFSLNPGPFNVKEHTLLIMLGSPDVAYGMGSVIAWETRYKQPLRTSFTFLFLISSQLLGLGLGGLCRRLVVYPASAIWPTNLSVAAMLNTLHAGDDTSPDRKGKMRFRVFLAAIIMSCVWVFVPGYLFTGLSYFSFICWIWPRNVVINQLFGSVTGLGLSILTFDWGQISCIGSPLVFPFWSQIHIFLGFVVAYWVAVPILYYSDTWKSGHLPIMGSSAYDRFARPYNLTRVFDSHTARFNVTAYEEYSPLYLPISFVITYMVAFAIPPALLVQTILHYWPVINRLLSRSKNMEDEKEDIHAKLMHRYPKVPIWYYLALSALCIALAVGSAFAQPDLDVPASAIVLSISLAVIFVVPQCYLKSLSGQTAVLNAISQIIPGALWPERPMTNMVFKVYTMSTMIVASNSTMGLKLGHYMKVPPRYLFASLFFSLSTSTIFQIGVKDWIFAGVEDVCEPGQTAGLNCSHSQVFYTASIIWGVIGPQRQFGKGAVYYGPVYALTAGALLPIIVFFWNRRYRGAAWLKSFNVAVALNGPEYIPPASGINYSSWFVVGIIFQYFLRTRRYRWWSRYNFVLAAALDSGTSIGILLCFFILQLPKRGTLYLNWWGNTVWQNTADAEGTPFYSTDPVHGF